MVPFMPMDIAGITAGVLRFPFWQFLLACWAGKTIKYLVVIVPTLWGFQKIIELFPFL